MDADTRKKLARCIGAYVRRFRPRGDTVNISAKVGGGGYAYVTNKSTGEIARFDIAAWRVRYVDLVKRT